MLPRKDAEPLRIPLYLRRHPYPPNSFPSQQPPYRLLQTREMTAFDPHPSLTSSDQRLSMDEQPLTIVVRTPSPFPGTRRILTIPYRASRPMLPSTPHHLWMIIPLPFILRLIRLVLIRRLLRILELYPMLPWDPGRRSTTTQLHLHRLQMTENPNIQLR